MNIPYLRHVHPIAIWPNLLSAMLLCCVLCKVTFADDAQDFAFFEQKVRPVLAEHCYGCHSQKAEKLRANLLLDSKAGWERGGDSGAPAIIPGDPDRSPLISSVKHLDLEMPPSKPKLPDSVIADLVKWVQMGAPDPRDGKIETKRADKSWWSLQPISRYERQANTTVSQVIDNLVEKKLSEQGLKLSPVADAHTLIRRMSYDLIGLPPTFEEVQTFERDFQSDPQLAVKQWTEKLLASPQYGEHWGRHWLDVVRFGESYGFERNVINDDIWPFRDYVIRSLNEDKPFNQLIVEHLAGDVVGKGNPDIEIGSAFLVAGPYDDVGNSDPVAAANIRAATLDDPITATSSAFLGLTIHCARCHNHKFDPIPTEDYYRLRSALEGISHAKRIIATPEQQQARVDALKPLNEERAALAKQRKEIEQSVDARAKEKILPSTRPKVDVVLTEESFAPVEARYLKFVMHACTSNPRSAVGAKLTEFQVWTDEAQPQNVALATFGTLAVGERSAVAEDFADAYGPQLVIDGVLGEQWFIGSPAVLKLEFPKAVRIHRITFSNDKGVQQIQDNSRGSTPTDFDVLISTDGEKWDKVASSEGREPWSESHAVEPFRKSSITQDEETAIAKIDAMLADVDARMRKVPGLKEVWVGRHEQPKLQTFVQKGGDPTKPLEPVVPSSLSVLDQVIEPYQLDANADQGERRLALAKWITSDKNPLTARVLANRIWLYHFGNGIVDTPSDFGFQGSRPTHPELLDFLAQCLIEGGWRIKDLHRAILSTRTYAQASRVDGENAELGIKLDKSARLLWRFPPRRLCAEEIRDTILKTTNNLDSRQGGPGFRLYKFTQNNVCTYFPLDKHGPETYRRSVYHQNVRAMVVDLLTDFDLPDTSFAAPKRANTTSPMQALTMLNHSFIQDMSISLANGLAKEFPMNEEQQIQNAYLRLLQRRPNHNELEVSTQFVRTNGLKAFCRAMLNSNEILFVD